MHRGQTRVKYLDGLRGLAISTVLAYHVYGDGAASVTPYGARYAHLPFVQFGWMGVELFFLISGYVIFVTIERCESLRQFLWRRWLRLFPIMLMASVLIFAVGISRILPSRFAPPKLIDLLPGITLIDSQLWHAVGFANIRSLDDTFWSLYVEVGFYVVFGCLFFWLGWKRAVASLIALPMGFLALIGLVSFFHVPLKYLGPIQWLGVRHYPWFASGALFYKAQQENSGVLRVLALLAGALGALIAEAPFMTAERHLLLVAVVLTFWAAQFWRPLQSLLETRIMLFIGAISYALYLVHSNLSVGLTASLAKIGTPGLVASWMAIACMVMVAWGLTKVEPRFRQKLIAWGATHAAR